MIYEKITKHYKWLSVTVIVLLSLFILSLITNFILVACLYMSKNNEKIILMPLGNKGNSNYLVSNASFNEDYFRDMCLSFIFLRLNVSPEKVASNHRLLLSYVSVKSRPDIISNLSVEENLIKESDITSSFYPNEIKADLENNLFEVDGVLKIWTGGNLINSLDKKYLLKVNYENAKFEIDKFIEVKNEKRN